jgi:hypothetical protein
MLDEQFTPTHVRSLFLTFFEIGLCLNQNKLYNLLKLEKPLCDFDKLEAVEPITVRSYLRLLTLFFLTQNIYGNEFVKV